MRLFMMFDGLNTMTRRGSIGTSSPSVLSDSTVLAYGSDGGQLTLFSWEGNTLWTIRIDDSVGQKWSKPVHRDYQYWQTTPSVGTDGNVYLAGYLSAYCIAIGKARLANTAWPTYNHDNARSGWAGRP